MTAKAKNVLAFIDAWRGECFWEVIMELHYHEIYLLWFDVSETYVAIQHN